MGADWNKPPPGAGGEEEMNTMIRLLVVVLASVILTGCADVKGDLRTGKFTVNSRFTNRKFESIEWRMGTNYFIIRGFASDQVEAMKVGLDAGMKAAAQAVKP